MSDYLLQRNGYYYYFRRVPQHVAEYDPRNHIKISLKTKDKSIARKRAIIHNETIEKFWRQLLTQPENATADTGLYYQKAVQTARLHDFAYRDISDLSANAELGEIVDRMLALQSAKKNSRETKIVHNSLTGTAEEPQILLSQAFDIYRPRCVDRLAGKTEHQIRKWENPRRLAMDNFIQVLGDKKITEVARKDVLTFQEWWLDRVREEGLQADSANRNFRHIKDILENVFIACDIEPPVDVETLFAKLKLKPGNNSRRSFEASYVQKVFLNSDALNGRMRNQKR